MLIESIPEHRWAAAQAIERGHWQGGRVGMLLEGAGTFANTIDILGVQRCAGLFVDKDVLDVGSGPWGLNLVALYPRLDRVKRWTAAEPLQRQSIAAAAIGEGDWAAGFLTWLEQRLQKLEFLQCSGESLALEASFDTVTSLNVLDHVRDPRAVLANIARALRPGGRLVLSVDCLSLLGRMKFEWLMRRFDRQSFVVQAHPFTFRTGHVVRLLAAAGFAVDEIIGAAQGVNKLAGRAHRPLFLCTRR